MAEPGTDWVLVAGVTTRPLAQSAARAGYRVTAVDAFGDLDLRAIAEVILARSEGPGQPYGPMEAAAAGSRVSAGLAAYTSNFENYPAAVARLARGRHLLGNGPATLALVRNPAEVMRVLRRHDLVAPESRHRAPGPGSLHGSWLLKPRRSGGGHGIMPWSPGIPVRRSMYIQQRIAGIPGSISFAADGVHAVLLGFSRQLVGAKSFGAGRFRYCGSILGQPDIRLFRKQRTLLERAAQLAAILTREFGLVGLNGIDFIARDGVPYPIEVNPRYSASMELVEQAHQLSMFGIHVRACQGELPQSPTSDRLTYGKAIVFARRDSEVGDSRRWLSRNWLADVPRPGEHIAQGRPVCTVFARARRPWRCHRLLIRRARTVYRTLRPARMRAA
jgi:uncharacterized protein